MTGTARAKQQTFTAEVREALLRGANRLIEAFLDEWSSVEGWDPERVLATRIGSYLPRGDAGQYTPMWYKQLGICVVVVAWK